MAETNVARLLTALDLDAYLDHLKRLDGHARAQRFAAGVDDQFILGHCLRAVVSRTALIGLFVEDELRAASELAIDADGGCAELSLAVERSYRGRGLGWTVLAGAIAEGRRRDVAQIRLDAAAGNAALNRLAQKAGFAAESGGRTITYRLDLSPVRRATEDRPAKPWWAPFRGLDRTG